MGLINETNAQYYAGQQAFPDLNSTVDPTFVCTFDTPIVSAFDSLGDQILPGSNYNIYVDGNIQNQDLSYVSNVLTNTLTLRGTYTGNVYVELTTPAVENNYGSYEYISLKDVVNNFMVAYVGMDKLIPRIKRSDVIFHAKRGLQEFSYDTLKSIKSQELTVPAGTRATPSRGGEAMSVGRNMAR